MPQAVTHIVAAILIAEFIREYVVKDKKKFSIYYVFIAGLAGILPDLDVAAFWILNFFGYSIEEVHRTFTHTLFVPLLFLILAFIFWNFKTRELGKHHLKLHTIFLMLALGSFIHLVLDVTIAGTIRPFYPVYNFSIGYNLAGFLPFDLQQIFFASLDAAIFILWLVWLEYKHKISNFI